MTPTERQRALAGPKSLKTPGSPEWCWQVVQVLKEQLRHVAEQWDLAQTALTELEKVEAWKKIPPEKPYGSKDAMLKAEVGLSYAAVRNRIQEASARAEALDGKTVHKGRGRRTSDDIIMTSETGMGTSAEYLTRRIARDHPDIFERMKAGEFRSARAAALEAGVIHPTQSVRMDDAKSAARTLRKHMKPDQLAALARLLAEG